jgi:RNA polymerase sigma-70 factor, ECF subfamily
MCMGDGEREWIAAAKGGDHLAFQRLVRAHARSLYRVSARILGDRALAEDAVQEALLNAYRSLDQFDGRSTFSSWLYRITVNAALGIRRAHTPGRFPLIEDETGARALERLPDLSPLPVEVAGARELGGSLERALEQLTALERTAFVLRHLEQYPLEEIARVLESNVNACKQAIFRAVRKLRSALEPWRTRV